MNEPTATVAIFQVPFSVVGVASEIVMISPAAYPVVVIVPVIVVEDDAE